MDQRAIHLMIYLLDNLQSHIIMEDIVIIRIITNIIIKAIKVTIIIGIIMDIKISIIIISIIIMVIGAVKEDIKNINLGWIHKINSIFKIVIKLEKIVIKIQKIIIEKNLKIKIKIMNKMIQ